MDFRGACYYRWVRYRLSKEDCIEMRECYEFYEDTHAPMRQIDLSYMFECTVEEAGQALKGTHPALNGMPTVKKRKNAAAAKVKRPVGRPKKDML